MFFQERIKSISATDKVLEIGPGANPHPRSDAYLELTYQNKEEEQKQFGHTGKLIAKKPIYFYDGKKFPFENDSFDYIICSHVLEHVEDIPFFLSELKRVAPKGYLEYPIIHYDYLFNFNVHLNFLKKVENEILWMKKSDTDLHKFKVLHKDFYKLLNSNSFSVFIEANKDFLFEGFEWNRTLTNKKTEDISLLTHKEYAYKQFNINDYVLKKLSFKTIVKLLWKKITNRF